METSRISAHNVNNVDNVKKIISNKVTSIQESEISHVNRIGKDLRTVKVVCNSSAIKQKIISHARINKPENVFFSEYLTYYRSKLFFEARKLRRENINNLRVYTRQGNICYKVLSSGELGSIRTMIDIDKLRNTLNELVNSGTN